MSNRQNFLAPQGFEHPGRNEPASAELASESNPDAPEHKITWGLPGSLSDK